MTQTDSQSTHNARNVMAQNPKTCGFYNLWGQPIQVNGEWVDRLVIEQLMGAANDTNR